MATLLVPWLGNPDLLKDLPLPAMIDVTVNPDARPDLDDLTARLTDAVPGATLDDHRVWLARLIGLGRTIAWTAMAILGVCRRRHRRHGHLCDAHRHGGASRGDRGAALIGATDDYIARQFATRAFTLAFKGGIGGLLLTIPALAAVVLETGRIEGGFLADLYFPLYGWAACALLPVVAALIAMATARLTVHATLVRLV